MSEPGDQLDAPRVPDQGDVRTDRSRVISWRRKAGSVESPGLSTVVSGGSRHVTTRDDRRVQDLFTECVGGAEVLGIVRSAARRLAAAWRATEPPARMLTTDEAAAVLGQSAAHVRRLCEEGLIAGAVRHGGRAWAIPDPPVRMASGRKLGRPRKSLDVRIPRHDHTRRPARPVCLR